MSRRKGAANVVESGQADALGEGFHHLGASQRLMLGCWVLGKALLDGALRLLARRITVRGVVLPGKVLAAKLAHLFGQRDGLRLHQPLGEGLQGGHPITPLCLLLFELRFVGLLKYGSGIAVVVFARRRSVKGFFLFLDVRGRWRLLWWLWISRGNRIGVF